LSAVARRVLFWTENHVIGGCDRYLADLVPALDPERWRVAFAGNHHPEFEAWLRERLPGVPRRTVPVASLQASPLQRLRRFERPRAQPYAPLATGVLELDGGPVARRAALAAVRYRQDAANYVRLRRLLRAARPDVLHVNNGGYPGAESCRVAVLAAAAEGVPRVVHFVHNMAFPPDWPQELERHFDRRVHAATDVWVTAAGRASDALSAAREIPREAVRTVHYGVPPAPAVAAADRAGLGFAAGALNVAVVASFEPRKGHMTLLDALARTPEVRAALVGVGEEHAAVEARASELGLADRVRFLGWRRDVDAILAAADALVLPSLANECLPYAILEAMAHGLPVIGTDVAGIPEEIADGETGFVVAPGDAAALAERLRRLAADPELRRAMGEAGRRRVAAEFSLQRMAAATTAVWTG
jgi:glycosyltransferase involved in cell wall biosynthesis